MNWHILIGITLSLTATMVAGIDFKIYWNVPSSVCSKKFGINVTNVLIDSGIFVNKGERFRGDKIATLYETKFGKYPYIAANGSYVNGGLPQLGDLKNHLKVSEDDIRRAIPKSNFDGLGIIDWEKWQPIWNFSWENDKIYRGQTVSLEKKRFPTSMGVALDFAKRRWEATTKTWMLQTLELAKKIRPKARWCYYHFPYCYNLHRKEYNPEKYHCRPKIKNGNNRLLWLWEASTALCPSVYYGKLKRKYDEMREIWFLHGALSEAIRISRQKMPIYTFINYRIWRNSKDVPREHFWLMMSYVASLGLDGVVIWGSSHHVKTKDDCTRLETYAKEVIAPAARNISSTVKWCGEKFCSNKGLCTWPKQPYTSWKCLTNRAACYFNPKDITCRKKAW